MDEKVFNLVKTDFDTKIAKLVASLFKVYL